MTTLIYANYAKPLADKLLALFLIVLTSPIMGIVAIMIFADMRSLIFFRQRRVGYKGQIFTIYKFRTMSSAKDAEGNLLPDGERLKRDRQMDTPI